MFEVYTELCRLAFAHAFHKATKSENQAMESRHLLYGLIQVHKILFELFLPENIPLEKLKGEIEKTGPIETTLPGATSIIMSEESKNILQRARAMASILHCSRVHTQHILLGILETECRAKNILLESGVSIEMVQEYVQRHPVINRI